LISTRVGVTIALLLSLAAIALGTLAYMSVLRDDEDGPGRLVQTRMSNSFPGEPVLFGLDDFFLSRDTTGRARALYVYPPGFYGHDRGCRVIWSADATFDTPSGPAGPGLFIDPCGGARFLRDGTLVFGPADRSLDYFGTSAGLDGVVVDTRTLFCGGAPAPDDDVTPVATATPDNETCDRVSRDEGP
jgi:hypothetical protein